MRILRIIALGAGILLTAVFLGRGIGMPSAAAFARGAAFITLLPFVFVLVSHGPRDVGRAFADAFAADLSAAEPGRLACGASLFRSVGRTSLALGVLCCFWACVSGFNAIAVSPGAPSPSDLAPWLAQGFVLPAVGGFLRWFVWGPLAQGIESGADSAAEASI